MADAEGGGGPKSMARRDKLIEIQKVAQKRWDEEKCFEQDAPAPGAPDESQPKHFVTFPYPYMNGMLHLGHTFSLSKTEFSMGYERLKGKKTLWPFGFHCTGMPIQAAADNLRRDIINMYKELNTTEEEKQAALEAEKVAAKEEEEVVKDPTKFVGKKTKAVAKKGKGNQWEVLESMDIARDIVPKFVDPVYWLKYFPPIAKEDLITMGVKVDWRRSFITTDVNGYYDSFIQWQFHKLKKLDKVNFGKRYSVFSPVDMQICADHDRATGEGVGPQEYTLIRMELMKLPAALESLQGKKVVMLAATLRPETMYGQTNCWVLPHEKDGSDAWYGVYQTHVENEVAIVSEHAARNMAFQGLTPAFGNDSPPAVMFVKGRDLVGLPLKAPLTPLTPIYTLPLLTISMRKGTGVVTSVPSDAPDDYMGLQDLKNKPALREKYGVTDEMVLPFEIIPIIEIPYRHDNAAEGSEPEMTDIAAKVACDEYKVASQNDKDKLALAKAKTYKIGFYEGKMTVGDYKGMSVQEAKPKVKEWMLATGQAYAYAEPEKEVMSRSGNECVVALTDQWYIKYGEEGWKAQVEGHLQGALNCYSEDTKLRFENALGWLSEWGCSRSFGLGTLLPWDKQFVIESLSDSTIYMAFYTVCHILQDSINGPFDGSVPGEGNVMPADLSEEVWDHILLDGPYPSSSAIRKEVLEKMKREFNYWYPVDLRVSGKDLIQNHLTFFLYNHAAIFPEKHWPRSMRTNGHVLLNNEKMSKSTGNFKTLKQAVAEYSADGMRFALALSGDGNEDANFEHDVANAAILKLTNELAFVEKSLGELDKMRSGALELMVDKIFDNEINRYVSTCESCYERMQYREAMIEGWDKLQNARDKYRAMAGPVGLHRDLVRKFIECQTLVIAPFCPHYSEHVWSTLLVNKEGIMAARWPVVGSVDPLLIRINTYFDKTLSDLRSKVDKSRTKKAVSGMTVYIAEEFLDWQQAALKCLKSTVDAGTDVTNKDFKKSFMGLPDMVAFKAQSKVLMPFTAFTIDDYVVRGAEAFELKVPYDEAKVPAPCPPCRLLMFPPRLRSQRMPLYCGFLCMHALLSCACFACMRAPSHPPLSRFHANSKLLVCSLAR
jgi:leucyl-tRNA synthetase